MPMVSLLIELSTKGFEGAQRDEQAMDLGRRLRDLNGAALSTIASAATSEDSKPVDGALIGAYELTVPTTREALSAAVETIHSWTTAATSRSAIVELNSDRLEISNINRARLDQTLEAFLDKHSEDKATPGTLPGDRLAGG